MGIMMKRKLHENNGASLIVALLFFVMCAIIGSVILTAATVAAGRTKNLLKTTQEEYTLDSAAMLLKQTVADEELAYTFDARFTDDTSVSVLDATKVNDLATTIQSMAQFTYVHNLLGKIKNAALGENVENVRVTARTNAGSLHIGINESELLIHGNYNEEYTETSDIDKVVHVTLQLDPKDDTLKPVTILLEMYENFDIKATLQLTEDAEDTNKNGKRKLTIWFYASDVNVAVSQVKKPADSTKHTRMGAFTVSWPNAKIVFG